MEPNRHDDSQDNICYLEMIKSKSSFSFVRFHVWIDSTLSGNIVTRNLHAIRERKESPTGYKLMGAIHIMIAV